MSFFDYLPACILNHSPKIIAAFEMDFLRNLPAFQKAIPQGEKFTMLLQLGWSVELPEVAVELRNRLAEAKNAFPEARFIILANAPREVEIIKDFCEVYLASHNAFLDPARYPLAKAGKRKYDALYIARITPFKRHYLAGKIKNLHLIGNYSEKETEYAQHLGERPLFVLQGKDQTTLVRLLYVAVFVGLPFVRQNQEAREIMLIVLDRFAQHLQPISFSGSFVTDGSVVFQLLFGNHRRCACRIVRLDYLHPRVVLQITTALHQSDRV